MRDRLLCKRPYAAYRDPLVIILIILAFLLLIRVLFAYRYIGIYVVNSSMSPTLTGAESADVAGGDFLYADTQVLPGRGDIVVLSKPDSPDEYIIKRVIALGGDTVYMDGGVVYIKYGGEDEFVALEEDYVLSSNCDPYLPQNSLPSEYNAVTVPQNCMFVLGDNRNVSHDSRYDDYGCFNYSQLVGVITDWSYACKPFFTALYTFFTFGV